MQRRPCMQTAVLKLVNAHHPMQTPAIWLWIMFEEAQQMQRRPCMHISMLDLVNARHIMQSSAIRLCTHAGSEGQVHADSPLIQHFHRQDNPSLQAGPLPRGQEAASNSPSLLQQQQGPDLLLGWQSAGGHMGVHHLYNCHLKVTTVSSRQLLL